MSSICKQFKSIIKNFHNSTITNPRTGRTIKVGGPTYVALVKECGVLVSQRKELEDVCKKFKQTPSINPRTGHKIKIGGPTYIRLQQECNETLTDEEKILKHVFDLSDKETKIVFKKWIELIDIPELLRATRQMKSKKKQIMFLIDTTTEAIKKLLDTNVHPYIITKCFLLVYAHMIVENDSFFGTRFVTDMLHVLSSINIHKN